jgi:hypothetical protein
MNRTIMFAAIFTLTTALLVPQGALAEYEGLESYEGPAKELGDLGSSGEPAE